MIEIDNGWGLDVENGPEWLFVTLRCQKGHTWDSPPLADSIWEVVDNLSAHQLILELQDVEIVHSMLIGQIILLHKRITSQGGRMRLAGISQQNQLALDVANLSSRFPWYRSREDAVRGQASKLHA
ncbi:MAG: hypothetical protein U9N87_15060 [Planctomycetota bacterium]|nr:hypothetical protein [Planctomycetota bacterium]